MNLFDYEILINEDFFRVFKRLIDNANERVYILTYLASLTNEAKSIYYTLISRRKDLDIRIILNGASAKALNYNMNVKNFLETYGVNVELLKERFMHTKLYIVDDYFIIGSHNLTSTEALEFSLMIHSRSMSDILIQLIENKTLLEPKPFRHIGSLNGIEYEVIANREILKTLLHEITKANERIKIITYVATTSIKNIYNEILKKQKEGIDTAILLNGIKSQSNKKTYEYLKQLGITAALSKNYIHAKLYIIDETALIGSHNLTSASQQSRLELSIAIKSKTLTNALNTTFKKIWQQET
jgi:phosphatidylserine/phosphatidylglycerophosphate/cardiolipin synthase-like enzyme